MVPADCRAAGAARCTGPARALAVFSCGRLGVQSGFGLRCGCLCSWVVACSIGGCVLASRWGVCLQVVSCGSALVQHILQSRHIWQDSFARPSRREPGGGPLVLQLDLRARHTGPLCARREKVLRTGQALGLRTRLLVVEVLLDHVLRRMLLLAASRGRPRSGGGGGLPPAHSAREIVHQPSLGQRLALCTFEAQDGLRQLPPATQAAHSVPTWGLPRVPIA